MSRSGKLSNLLSMWEKKAEESNTSSNIPPKRNPPVVFKKQNPEVTPPPSSNVTSVPLRTSGISQPIISDPKVVNIVDESRINDHQPIVDVVENDNNNQINPIEQQETPTATTPVVEEPQDQQSYESQAETTIIEEEEPSTVETETTIEEPSTILSEEVTSHQEEETTSEQSESLSHPVQEPTQDLIEPQQPSPSAPSIEVEETITKGTMQMTISEFKAVISCSIMASSLEPIQQQVDFILQQNNCTNRDDLPEASKAMYDTLQQTIDMYMDNILSMSGLLTSIMQCLSMKGITEDIKLVINAMMRNLNLIDSDTSNLYSLFSTFVQLAFGSQDKIDLLLLMLRDNKMKQVISKYAPMETYKNVFGSVYAAIAKADFQLLMDSYVDSYFESVLPPTHCASYCCQLYKEAAKYPEHVDRFINEAIVSLNDFTKMKNEPMEKLFCNSLYNMVKSSPERFFNGERYEYYEKTLLSCKEQLFDSNRVYIDELFDLKKSLEVDDGDAQSSEDFILVIEYNGKKKKVKESGSVTFAQFVSSILEKFQIQEEHQNMNDLFDKGIIVECFEEGINDWIELERIDDIPRSPKVGKVRIIKEEIQVNQISQIIERNTNIQLVNDKYQILKRIGKGGFGSVYSANAYSSSETQPSMCALKYIEIDSIVNFNRSMREGIQMLQLDHANIARISDVFEVQSSDIGIMGVETKRYLCFAMPLYSHGDLYELVKNQSQIITVKLLGSIMKQLMDSLAYLHDEYSIVHRDIKPQNVLIESIDLVNKTLKPILSDFGLAKTLIKTETQVAGTASYMSPEMSTRRGYNLSTDIWSMGVMFYQLLSFDFITDVKGKVQNNEFDLLSTQIDRTWSGQDSEIVSSLKKLTFDMLSLDPETRPTAKQAFESLSAY